MIKIKVIHFNKKMIKLRKLMLTILKVKKNVLAEKFYVFNAINLSFYN